MGKYLLNLGYDWSSLQRDGQVDGYVFNPSGLNKEQASRRPLEPKDDQWILFDPQLYLSGLDGNACARTCANLATYKWFGIETPRFDSSEMNTKTWMSRVKEDVSWAPNIVQTQVGITNAVRDCLEYQRDFGVTHLIAPAPLIGTSDDQFATQIQWLDAACQLREEFSLPVVATVSISDYLLAFSEPSQNILLQTILDNVTVRDFDGVYLLVVQEDNPNMRLSDLHTVQSLLYVSRVVSEHAAKDVLVNFADDLGHACVAAGAIGFVGGTTSKARKLCLSDFVDRSGGAPYPKFYSHALVADLTMPDLEKLRDARLLRLVAADATPFSESLLSALQAGGHSNAVPDWRPSRNNVRAANKHRIALSHTKAWELTELNTQQKLESVLQWLQEAAAHMSQVKLKCGANPLSEDGRHIEVWESAFEQLLTMIDDGKI